MPWLGLVRSGIVMVAFGADEFVRAQFCVGSVGQGRAMFYGVTALRGGVSLSIV